MSGANTSVARVYEVKRVVFSELSLITWEELRGIGDTLKFWTFAKRNTSEILI